MNFLSNLFRGLFLAVSLLWVLALATYFSKEIIVAQFLDTYMAADIRVANVARLVPGKISTLELHGVTVPGEETDPIAIERLLVSIDLAHLVTNTRVIITALHIDGMTVRVNELLANPSSGSVSPWLQTLSINKLILNHTQVLYRDADQDVSAVFSHIAVADSVASGPLNITVTGTVNQLPLRLFGKTSTRQPFAFDQNNNLSLQGTWNDLQASGQLRSDPDLVFGISELNLKLSTPSARALLDLAGASEVRDGALRAQLSITSDGKRANVQGNVELADFSGTIAAIVKDQKNMDVAFTASGPSLFEAGAVIDFLDFSPEPFSMTGNVRVVDQSVDVSKLNIKLAEGTLVGSVALPQFPELFNATVNITGKDFSPVIFRPVAGTCTIPDEPMQWQLRADRSLSGGENIDIAVTSPARRVHLKGELANDLEFLIEGFSVSELASCLGLKNVPDVAVTLGGHLYSDFFDWHFPEVYARTDNASLAGSFHWVDGSLTTDWTLTTPGIKQLLHLWALPTGPLADVPVSLTVSAQGQPEQLTLLSATLSMANNAEASLIGTLGNIQTREGLSLTANISGDNLREILPDFEATQLAAQPFGANGKIQYLANRWQFNDLQVKVARSTLTGNVSFPAQPLDNLTIELEGEGANLQNLAGPWLDWQIQELPFRFSLQLNHNPQRLNIPLFEGSVGAHRFSMQLLLDDPPDVSSTSGFVAINGPSSHELGLLLNQDIEHLDNPYALQFSLGASRDTIAIRDFTARLGDSTLAGDIEWQPGTVPVIKASIESEQLYLPTFFPALEDETEAVSSATRLFDPTPLNLNWLRSVEGELVFASEKIYSSPGVHTALDFKVTISKGVLKTSSLNWQGLHINGNATLKLSATNDQADIQLDTTSSRIPLLWLLGGTALPSNSPTLYVMSLTSQGQSVADWMANLNGQIVFNGGGGSVKKQGLDWMLGDFISNVGRSLVQREPSTDILIHCTAGGLQISSGVVTLDPALSVRTNKLDVFVTGKIDLKKETPDLLINTRSRTGLGISVAKVLSPRTRVTGSLMKPVIQPDVTSSALSGSAAYLTAGMSIIAAGVFDRIRAGSVNPCQNVYDTAAAKPVFGDLIKSAVPLTTR